MPIRQAERPANQTLANVEPTRTARSKSIGDAEMRRFQDFLKTWVAQNCEKGASIRAIADRLGVTSTEYTEWSHDKARPGITRLVKLRETTHQTIDAMLGFTLPLPTEQRQSQLDQVAKYAGTIVDTIRSGMKKYGWNVPPHSKLAKVLEELDVTRHNALENKRRAEREIAATKSA